MMALINTNYERIRRITYVMYNIFYLYIYTSTRRGNQTEEIAACGSS